LNPRPLGYELLDRHPDGSRSFPPHPISPADTTPIQCHWLPLVPGRSRLVPLPILLPPQVPFDFLRPRLKRS
jgi:hypothetical protein